MVTIIIIAVTFLVSILCFTGTLSFERMVFNAYAIRHRKEWYRMLSHGLVHGGWAHLIFNMIALYCFLFPQVLKPGLIVLFIYYIFNA